ncbi:uncharacterized protein LOC130429853 [Triplophysa dalaica]|uniref:uncharacterized protein LOC130429853 n=1 Tax=Triplophysa dalaica TaxID=1582913 RepID=UPI0024DFA583|nr:uncharacterized protein LOC130429853 [Triplophysa dalaica]
MFYKRAVQGIFRDKLELDIQTGSLTITNVTPEHTGYYVLMVSSEDVRLSVKLTVTSVFGDTVSVTEGDSVTLHTGLTDIQRDDVIEWTFGDEQVLIAVINRAANKISLSDGSNGRFNGSLKLNDQNGDLTITNLRSEHTGVYHLDITREKTTTKTFSVGVFGDTGGVKQVSVLEGDSVTLHTDLTDIQRDAVILWVSEREKTVVAQINRAAQIFSVNYTRDNRSVSKMQLDHQNGDLTFRNIRARMSGLYQVHIISSTHTLLKRFNITASDRVKTVSVMKGDSVSLHNDLTDVQKDEVLFWSSDISIAEIDKTTQNVLTYDDADRRFKNRMQINNQTGSLTIQNISITDSGLYNLEIIGSRYTLLTTFIITVCDALRTVEVNKGEPVILNAGVGSQKYNQLLWKFEDERTFLAQLDKTGQIKLTNHEGFKDRMNLDHQTGDLTIRYVGTEHSGVYHLEINSNRHSLFKKFKLTVHARHYLAICAAVIPPLLLILALLIYKLRQGKKQTSKRRKMSPNQDCTAPVEQMDLSHSQ